MSLTKKIKTLQRIRPHKLLFGLTLSMFSAVCVASATKQALSEQAVRDLGEDPASAQFYQLPHVIALDNADQNQPNGGANTFYSSIAASEFRPRSSNASFNVPNHAALLCQTDSTNSLAEAQIQFSQGATLQFLRIYANDSSDQDLNVALLERCQPIASAGNVTTTVLGSVLTSGTPGRLTQSIGLPAGTTVDNVLCTYSLRVQLASTVNGCATGLFLDKARVQWIP
jgi:hypothetical protein